jgi:hypothetical protein
MAPVRLALEALNELPTSKKQLHSYCEVNYWGRGLKQLGMLIPEFPGQTLSSGERLKHSESWVLKLSCFQHGILLWLINPPPGAHGRCRKQVT